MLDDFPVDDRRIEDFLAHFKDPDEFPEDWDICRDLLEIQVKLLEEWMDSPTAAQDFELLAVYDPGVDWFGSDRFFHALQRAKVELAASGLAEQYEKHVRYLGKKARKFAEHARRAAGKEDEKDKWDTLVYQFHVVAAAPCLRFFRSLLITLRTERARTGPSPNMDIGEVSSSGKRPESSERWKLWLEIAKDVHELLRQDGLRGYFARQAREAARESLKAADAADDPKYPLPVPSRHVSLPEKFGALAAIYDFFWRGAETIGSDMPEGRESEWYYGLVQRCGDLEESDAMIIQSWLEDVRSEIKQLNPKTLRKPRKRGPKGPRYDRDKDRKYYEEWKASRFRDYKKFALWRYGDDSEIKVQAIKSAVERERKRRKR